MPKNTPMTCASGQLKDPPADLRRELEGSSVRPRDSPTLAFFSDAGAGWRGPGSGGTEDEKWNRPGTNMEVGTPPCLV